MEIPLMLFTQFEPELSKKIQQVGVVRKFKSDEFLMKTGQSIRSAVLVTKGIIKVFREDDEGNEIFMYNWFNIICIYRAISSSFILYVFIVKSHPKHY